MLHAKTHDGAVLPLFCGADNVLLVRNVDSSAPPQARSEPDTKKVPACFSLWHSANVSKTTGLAQLVPSSALVHTIELLSLVQSPTLVKLYDSSNGARLAGSIKKKFKMPEAVNQILQEQRKSIWSTLLRPGERVQLTFSCPIKFSFGVAISCDEDSDSGDCAVYVSATATSIRPDSAVSDE